MPSVLVCVLAPEKEIRAEDDTEWGGPEPTGRSADDDGSGGADDAITLSVKRFFSAQRAAFVARIV